MYCYINWKKGGERIERVESKSETADCSTATNKTGTAAESVGQPAASASSLLTTDHHNQSSIYWVRLVLFCWIDRLNQNFLNETFVCVVCYLCWRRHHFVFSLGEARSCSNQLHSIQRL